MKRTTSILALAVVFLAPIVVGADAATLSWEFAFDPASIRLREAAPGRLAATVDGYAALEYLGYPALPYRVVSVLVPQGENVASYRLEILEEGRVAVAEPLASFAGLPRDDGTRGAAVMGVDAEGAGAPIPPARVTLLGSSFCRGYRIASFALYPLVYDAKGGNLVVAKRFRLVLETGPIASSVGVATRERRVEGFRDESRRRVEAMVINPEAAAAYSFQERKVEPRTKAFLPSFEPSMEGSSVALLIVTNDAMAPAFQRLADWKTKKGIPAVVRTIEWISRNYRAGADLTESVRTFIRDAYEKWGVEWVVLGGDTDVIPARYGCVRFSTTELVPTDMYYSCLDGSWNADGDSLWGEAYHSILDPGDDADLYAEVFLGRMPASTLAEANLLVDKTINYSTPTNAASKKKFLLLGQILFPMPYHPGDPITMDGAETAESVFHSHLEGKTDAVTARLYQTYSEWPGSLPISKTATIDSFDAGVNHVLYIGHGSYYNMSVGTEAILNYDAGRLTNGAALFSLYIVSCANVAFDTECLGESYLLAPAGGAFAVTGSSRSAYPSSSRPYLDQYYDILFDHDVVQLGKIQTLSREPFTPNAYTESPDRLTHFIYNYLGDPEVCMFRGASVAFAVSKPGSAHFGANDIQIQVTSGGAPYDSALVCLYKPGDDYEYALTGPSGTVTFAGFLCKSAGDITLTVTGLDHARYTGTIPVTQAVPAYLKVSATKIEDTFVGNNDQVLDAGETVNLKVKLKNTGQATASKLYAIVRSIDPDVTVSDSTALFPVIPAGSEAWGSDSFRFGVSPSVSDGRPVEFTIAVHDSTGGSWSEKFAFNVHAPEVELYANIATDTLPYGDNDGVIENGESFLLRVGVKNFGTGAAYGLSAKIRSLDPDVVVTDSLATYGSLSTLGVSHGDGFVLHETNITQVNYFQFTLTDVYGRVFTKRMELRRPGAPRTVVLNSTYGPNEIHVTWHPPSSLEPCHYQIYRSITPGGPYSLASRDIVSYTLFRDYGLLGSTRYYYVITAVDSCGNEGPRSPEATATTSPPMLAGWPEQVAKETASSVKVGDIDGDTHPDVVCGSDYIYAWHGNGIELRDGDGQPVTWGVFNTYGSDFVATVALANLDGIPGLEIIGASWSTKQIFIFNKNGAVLPGWPKSTTSLCWASPVVGDIDGDGALEIIAYDVAGVVYAWHVNGTEVRDGDNNPATNGPFFVTKNPGTWHISTPALADMDEDGVQELIVCSPNDSIYCLNGNGSRVPGWPVKVLDSGSNITASPVVGDIDGDGHLEMVVPSSYGRMYCLRRDGSWEPGWPVWVYDNTSTIAPSAALADLDKDGKLEIVIAGLDSQCYVFRYNGTPFPGWPQPYTTSAVNATTESSPVVADIEGDGNLDILLGCEDGVLHAWKSNGQYVAGFPVLINAYLRGTPVVCDLDSDGRLELATSCWDKNIYIWDLTGQWYHGCIAWNGFHANIYNTGWKEFTPATDADQIMCSYRLGDGLIGLDWKVTPEVDCWNLYREDGGGAFKLIAARLRPSMAGVVSYIDRSAEEGVAYRYKLEAEEEPGTSSTTHEIMLPVTAVRLYQNHPNPFNPSTTIPFAVPGDARSRERVLLAVYDVSGALVRTLVDEEVVGGRRQVRWEGRNNLGQSVASGIYFARLSSGAASVSVKMVLLR